jgi:HAMP domain-containing protein
MFAPGQERPAAKRRWQPEPEFKINALLEQGDAVVDALVAAKTAITKANAPIQEAIYRLAELKSAVAFLQRLDTTHGKSPMHVLTGEALEYTAQVRAAEVEALVSALRRQIDELQDRIDAFNARTMVDLAVPEDLLY